MKIPVDLKIGVIQSDTIWHQTDLNLINIEKKIKSRQHKNVNLWVLPEMFNSGFTSQPELVYENMKGKTIMWMKKVAFNYNSAIMGSIVVKEKEFFYNRLIFVYPDKKIVYYDKKHLFTFSGENKMFKSGNKNILINYLGWNIRPLVCYDLRFPVWSRNIDNYDLVLYVANWPITRINAWDSLLKARAIENMSYSLGVNRVGVDENNLIYPGHSSCYDLFGSRLFFMDSKDDIDFIDLSYSNLHLNRKKYPFLLDRDNFDL
jgi:predicted amidohydrolase